MASQHALGGDHAARFQAQLPASHTRPAASATTENEKNFDANPSGAAAVDIPEWENAAAGKGAGARSRPHQSAKVSLVAGLDAVLPPHKRYLGRSRKTFLWVLLGVTLAGLALIIGLAVGLTKRKS